MYKYSRLRFKIVTFGYKARQVFLKRSGKNGAFQMNPKYLLISA